MAKLFNSGMKESITKEIIITDISHNVFLHFLGYIYSDFVKIEPENVMELLCVADKYGITRLKRICELYILESQINFENVVQFLDVADRCNALELRSVCQDFIVENFGIIMCQDEYLLLAKTNPTLIKSIQFAASKYHFKKRE